MDELVTAGARLRAAVPTPAPRFERIAERAARRRHHRRVNASIAGALAVALATAGVWAGVNANRNTVRVQVPTTQPHVTALSPQMRAHLGLDVPTGWVPFDLGSVRVWVPADAWRWYPCEPHGGLSRSSLAEPDTATIVLERVRLHSPDCTSVPSAPFVSIRVPQPGEPRLPVGSGGPPAETVNGYGAYQSLSLGKPGDEEGLVVPALGALVTVRRGTLGERVLQTIAPSARHVVATPGLTVSTVGWHTVVSAGVSVRVPRTWRLHDASGKIAPCFGESPHTVTIGTYSGVSGCAVGDDEAPAGNVLGDHLVIDPTLPTSDDGYSAVITRSIPPHSGIELTLGPDGRIDAAILASVRRVSPGGVGGR